GVPLLTAHPVQPARVTRSENAERSGSGRLDTGDGKRRLEGPRSSARALAKRAQRQHGAVPADWTPGMGSADWKGRVARPARSRSARKANSARELDRRLLGVAAVEDRHAAGGAGERGAGLALERLGHLR